MRLRTALSAVVVSALVTCATMSGCGSTKVNTASVSGSASSSSASPTTASPTPAPTVTVTSTPTPTVTVTPTPTVTVTRPNPTAAQTSAAVPHLTNAAAVVEQYYQDITNHDYAAAWALGGSNIAGPSYARYVAGFATTAGISLGTVSQFGSSTVEAVLYATQTDGTVKVYQGTYTVSNGVLVGANIHQVS